MKIAAVIFQALITLIKLNLGILLAHMQKARILNFKFKIRQFVIHSYNVLFRLRIRNIKKRNISKFWKISTRQKRGT